MTNTTKIMLGLAGVLAIAGATASAQLSQAKKLGISTKQAAERANEGVASEARATDYGVDGSHSTVLYKIQHAGVSNFYGRFDNIAGDWSFDPNDLEGSSLNFRVRTDKVNSGNRKRDEHLRSSDFFNAKQFPTTTFESASFSPLGDGMYELTGELTLLGETKQITATFEWLGTGTFRGAPVAAFEARFTFKRSEFGMTEYLGPLGDEVSVIVAVEGGQK